MIDNFFKNKYAQAVLVFFVVLGIVYFYQSLTRPAYNPEAMHEQMGEMMEKEGATEEMMEVHDQMGDMMDSVNSGAAEGGAMGESMMMDYTGTHIMPNGDVMLRSGEVIPDAIINDDGSVTMPDGTVLESVMDMRN